MLSWNGSDYLAGDRAWRVFQNDVRDTFMGMGYSPIIAGGSIATTDTLVTAQGDYVLKAGDAMTGALILNADPSTALGAATKQYVDAEVGAITSSQWSAATGGINFAGGNVGIGTTSPGARLEVAGQIKITGGTPGANKILTSDATGLATWVDPPSTTPTGAAGGDLDGTYPNPTIRAGAVTIAKTNFADGDIAQAKVAGLVTSLAAKLDDTQLDTNVALGADNTKIPSQAAVKSYVDGQVGAINESQWSNETGGINYAGGKVGISVAVPQATLDVNGTIRLAKNFSQPEACGVANDGILAMTSGYITCVCKSGTGWVQTSDGATPCSWTTAGKTTISNVAALDGACSPDGALAKDPSGDLLICKSGLWKQSGGGSGAETSGQYVYYNLAACPTGWVLADGTNGTIDLRGEFIRGLDSSRGVDPGRVLGSFQNDMFESHTHLTYANTTANSGGSGAMSATGCAGCVSRESSPTGGSETRPRNVALLPCMKI